MRNRRYFLTQLATGLIIASSPIFIVACNKSHYGTKLTKDTVVLALGDSLTAGYGATPDTSYPAILAHLTGWHVVNAGVSGDTSAQALTRLPDLLKQHQPKLVIVSIGGNDFLQRLPETQTHQNISRIIETIQQANIALVLVGVPTFGFSAVLGKPSDHVLYQNLAEQYNIPLLSGEWSTIIAQDKLKSDHVHPNAQGYKRFANRLAAFLFEQGF